jgi:NAD(P)-dependent dehydrogenase (short-subunit alcohol dehydrogenase family)
MASILRKLPGVAVITGAGGTGTFVRPIIVHDQSLTVIGIGAAVAKGFARSGCTKIAITDINLDTLKQTKNAILSIDPSIKVFDRAGDISDETFVDSFTDQVTSKFSRLDYAVNCAGVLGGKPVKQVEMTMDAFDRLNNINYRGSWLSSRAQLRNMLKQEPLSEQPGQRGSIVNIASQLGIVARPGAGMSIALTCLSLR